MSKILQLAFLLISPLTAFAQPAEAPRKELSDVVTGLKPPIEIVNDFEFPLIYLKTLSVRDPEAKLDSRQKYQLARQLIRVHHLTQAFADQSYFMDRSEFPILKLFEKNFPGFDRLHGEGGYNTRDAAEFFEKHPERWSP